MKTSQKNKISFGDMLVKTSHQRILAYLLAHPSAQFYGAEICAATGISVGQTSKVMGELLMARLVEKETKGKTELYKIITESPIMRSFKVTNTLITIEPLIEKMKDISRHIILFGSCARGENIEESDLDLFVVSPERERVLELVAGFETDEHTGFSGIKAVVRNQAEWTDMEEKDPVFFGEVRKGMFIFERKVDESRL